MLTALLLTSSCTDNARARRFGGTANEEIKAGHKVIGATWKDADLWILTRPMRLGEVPETVILHEASSWGVVQGTVIMEERDSQETARINGR